MNFSQPVKKIKKKLRDLYFEGYTQFESFISHHIVPYLWDERSYTTIKAGDLVHLKNKLTLKKYHGIVLEDPLKVITDYGLVPFADNIRWVAKVRWNYGSKIYSRYEFCGNLEVISGAK